ncbi:MAG: hypothetical protein R3E94_14445 [Burkholderiaceae bacterium]
MKHQTLFRSLLATALTTSTLVARAHDGHGLTGGHWHATDALGYVVVGLIALAIWLSRK